MSILGGFIAALTSRPQPITIPSNWGVVVGNNPAAANKTLTVPAGNNGNIRFVLGAVDSGVVQYRKNSGTYTTFSDGEVVNFANGDTLNFRLLGATSGDTGAVEAFNNHPGLTTTSIGTFTGSQT